MVKKENIQDIKYKEKETQQRAFTLATEVLIAFLSAECSGGSIMLGEIISHCNKSKTPEEYEL